MEMKSADKNFDYTYGEKRIGMREYRIPCEPFDLYGIKYCEESGCFLRMPRKIAQNISEGVTNFSAYTAGGRLRFSTNSVYFGIKVRYDGLNFMSTMPLCSACGFVLLEETERRPLFLHVLTPERTEECGFERTVRLPGGKMRHYILYFPLYNGVRDLRIFLDTDAAVAHGKKYRDLPPVVYYGSSITEGACATRPDNAYEAFICNWNKIDFVNLGFGGQARGEKAMAEYLASSDCSLFVCDYDYNAPDASYLERTHYKFYEVYRRKKPNVPILFLTKPDTDTNFFDAEERRNVVYESYCRALRTGDKNVYFADGSTLFGRKDRSQCTVDGCHPNDVGYYKMAQNIYKKMISVNKAFR